MKKRPWALTQETTVYASSLNVAASTVGGVFVAVVAAAIIIVIASVLLLLIGRNRNPIYQQKQSLLM